MSAQARLVQFISAEHRTFVRNPDLLLHYVEELTVAPQLSVSKNKLRLQSELLRIERNEYLFASMVKYFVLKMDGFAIQALCEVGLGDHVLTQADCLPLTPKYRYTLCHLIDGMENSSAWEYRDCDISYTGKTATVPSTRSAFSAIPNKIASSPRATRKRERASSF